jgi:hypothetical protein
MLILQQEMVSLHGDPIGTMVVLWKELEVMTTQQH